MTRQVTLRQSGGSVTATLPREMVERLRLAPGDKVSIVETGEGLLLTPYDPAFENAIRVYRRGARRFRNALRELAR
jgi:putative addiction module antidote